MIERLKKVRGFKSIRSKKTIVKLEVLEGKFKDGDKITPQSLLEAKIVDKNEVAKGIKILSTGSITKKLVIDKGILLSKSAKDAIIKAGGEIAE